MSRISLFLISTVLLFASCKKSSSPDSEDYSTCRYELWYKLSYSPVDPNQAVAVVYLNASGKSDTLALADTLLEFRVTYKYGDSLYVKFNNSDIYFLDRQNNRVDCSYKISNSAGGPSCPAISRSEETSFALSSTFITAAIFEVPPRVLQ